MKQVIMDESQKRLDNLDFVSNSKSHEEKYAKKYSSQDRQGKHSEVEERVKNDEKGNTTSRSVYSYHTNEFEPEEEMRDLYRNPERSGDWKDDLEGWKMIEPLSSSYDKFRESTEDWKSKNLYNFPNYERPSYWSSLCNNYRDENFKLDDITLSEKTGRNYLLDFREYLANYQESYGTPRTEYSFAALVNIMGQATGRSLLALIYVLINVVPIAEVLLCILRFVLDKAITIQTTKDFQQMLVRYAVLSIQLVSIYVCLTFIFGFIVLPIIDMIMSILGKIMLYT